MSIALAPEPAPWGGWALVVPDWLWPIGAGSRRHPGRARWFRAPASPALSAQSRLARHSNTVTSARAMAARNASALR